MPPRHRQQPVHLLSHTINFFYNSSNTLFTIQTKSTVITPNVRHLSAAIEVHRLRSISAAAGRVHLSQSAVTQSLAKLEQQLGSPLFTRTSTGVFPTAAGTIFFARAQRALDHLKALEQTLFSRSKSRQLYRRLTNAQLRAMLAVVETGNYTRAAQRLGLTQPTVHRAVREMESLCQQTFFQRSPAGVEANWQARQIARHISLFFAEIAQSLEELSEFNGRMTGTIRIGSLPLARTRMVPKAVTQLLKKFPEAQVKIIDGPYEEQLHALLHGQIDVIVGALRRPAPSNDIVQELLFHDPLNIVVKPNHWLATTRHVTPQQLSQLEWIAPREHTPAREAFSQFFNREGLNPPTHVIECSSLVAIRELLLDSDRAALLPARQVETDVNSGLLAVSPRPLKGTSREIGLALRKGWQPTRVQSECLALLREQIN